jgi:GNAT superfamily N-acetyltransferase
MRGPGFGVVRLATIGDAMEIAQAHVVSWRESYAGILPASMIDDLSIEDRAIKWARTMTRQIEAVVVAEEDGRIVGLGSCGRQRSEALWRQGFGGEVGALYVLKDFQGRGYGRALMAAMFDLLASAGAASASLWVLRENLPARGFYEQLGGVAVAERQEMRGPHILLEATYGWRDLAALQPWRMG